MESAPQRSQGEIPDDPITGLSMHYLGLLNLEQYGQVALKRNGEPIVENNEPVTASRFLTVCADQALPALQGLDELRTTGDPGFKSQRDALRNGVLRMLGIEESAPEPGQA